ncbi:hypothetical protein FF011L_09720 [Roseimaritima multifibrata]|uniref:Uncharacterized protein n=1 Tax=Roseimaritima multifibrata TaxID=1930274 RepID=A0A517MBJ4_9BACT|nr:hypothetical protein FF011L_09720 [Roseimaritima multifibrata]
MRASSTSTAVLSTSTKKAGPQNQAVHLRTACERLALNESYSYSGRSPVLVLLLEMGHRWSILASSTLKSVFVVSRQSRSAVGASSTSTAMLSTSTAMLSTSTAVLSTSTAVLSTSTAVLSTSTSTSTNTKKAGPQNQALNLLTACERLALKESYSGRSPVLVLVLELEHRCLCVDRLVSISEWGCNSGQLASFLDSSLASLRAILCG